MAVNKYRLMQGKHGRGDVTYYKGDVLESTRPLDKTFPNRFVLVSPDTPLSTGKHRREIEAAVMHDPEMIEYADEQALIAQSEQAALGSKAAPVVESVVEELTTEFEGVDVTADFADAEAARVQIFKSDAGYNVFTAGDGESQILNEAPLTKKSEVKAILKERI